MYGYHRCRCTPCCDANRAYNRRASALRRPRRRLVDAGPVRERVLLLRRSGLTLVEIGAVAGVSEHTLEYLLIGRKGRTSEKVSASIAKAVMSVRSTDLASVPERSAGSKADGVVPALQVQALQAAGWTVEDLAERSALRFGTLYRILRGNGTTVAVRAEVDDLYRRMRGTCPRQETDLQRRRVRRALKRAAEHGWTTGMAEGTAYEQAA